VNAKLRAMKRVIPLAILLALGAESLAQGYLNFANIGGGSLGIVNAPVTNATVNPAVRASGHSCLAMLYIGPAGTLDPRALTTNGVAGPPSIFNTGGQAGYFTGGRRAISGYSPGQTITAQVRVWLGSAGSSWEEAEGFGGREMSEMIQVTLSEGAPNTPTNLVGLRSILLYPGSEAVSGGYFPGQTVPMGGTATFSSNPYGLQRNFQWRFNGTNIPGATSSNFTRVNVQPAYAGTYSVRTCDLFKCITNSAVLTVLVPLLASPVYNSDGFQCTDAGEPGSNYVIQSSTDLGVGNWLPLVTNAAPFTFVDSNALLYPQRFYRAVPAP
jgi:hypothetical protein